MKSLHVITGLWKHTGGPSESVPALCRSLQHLGNHVTLATLAGDMAAAVGVAELHGVSVRLYAPTMRHSIWYSQALSEDMPRLVGEHDIVHVHAMWQHPGWRAAAEARRQDKSLVLSPRGSLLPKRLQKSAWKKRIAAALFDRRLISSASVVHATSADEALAVRGFGYRGPITVIPNGIDVLPEPTEQQRAAARRWLEARYPEVAEKRILLFMSRIEPTKGVVTLAKAWSDLAREFPEWILLIVGPDERGHSREVVRQLEAGNAAARAVLAGPLYDEARDKAYLASELFVLPTTSENFGMVVAEALARGIPAITTQGAPWKGLETECCGWWPPADVEGIRSALASALSKTAAELQVMGRRGRLWMAATHAWEQVASQMRDTYSWALQETLAPSCIQIEL